MLRVGRASCALLALTLSLLTRAATVRAQSQSPADARAREQGAALEVVIDIERAPGADACPDTESVFAAMQRLFPERSLRQSSSANESAASARVAIRPLSSGGYEAVMTVLRPRPGERVILEHEADCRGLADALALAFVMLVEPPATNASSTGDAEIAAASAATTHAPETAPRPAPEAVSSPEPSRSPQPVPAKGVQGPARTHTFRVNAGLAGVGGFGLLSEPSGGVTGRLELFHRSGWGAVVEGVRLWSTAAEGEGGSVKLTLWAGTFGPYYLAPLTKHSSLAAGVLLGLGGQSAHVENFVPTSRASDTIPWRVVLPEVAYRVGFASFASAFAAAGPVIQLRPQSFSVIYEDSGATVGIAAAPRVGVRAELGISLGADVF